MKHCENTTLNVRMIGDQEFYAWRRQFESKTDAEVMGEIRRFEKDAARELAKANKHWAYAKNEKGGWYYQSAREGYEAARVKTEKAEELRKLLESRGHTRSFVGKTEYPTLMSDVAVLGAALTAGITIIDCLAHGDDAEEILRKTTANTACSYGSVKLSTAAMKHAQKGLEFLGASGVTISAGSLLTGVLVAGTVASVGNEALRQFFEGLAEDGFWKGMDRAADAVLTKVSDAGDRFWDIVNTTTSIIPEILIEIWPF